MGDQEVFRGNNFELWKVKMQEILTKQKCVEALKSIASMSACLTKPDKTEIVDKAINVIILYLGDIVLREVSREKIEASMWKNIK